MLILVFNGFFLGIYITAPSPIYTIITARLLKYGCTTNDALAYHLMIYMLSSDMVKTISLVSLKYFISMVSLFPSPLFGFFNILHKITIVFWMSGLYFLHKK